MMGYGEEGDFRGGRTTGPARVAAGNDSADKQCICGIAAVQRTVQKEGPNKGKKFWCCSKAMGQPDKCNFFEWTICPERKDILIPDFIGPDTTFAWTITDLPATVGESSLCAAEVQDFR
ncbi:GRF zinc finger [Ancylostoma duodenale]|uniref:GRF zinc finger n=1 Tax=Ancylostoma duodenale TaxID=51022 RepID=A0A0C2CSF7_9BILA|nr:GRF zinc finger [Ancylostoma duodenale]